jgi:hypothetical protein
MMRKALAYLLIAAVALISYGPASASMSATAAVPANADMAPMSTHADMASMPAHADMASLPCADQPMGTGQQDRKPPCTADFGNCMARCAMLIQPTAMAFQFSHYPKPVVAAFDWAAPSPVAASLPFRPPRSSILS